jgi:hypothetical protein
MTITITINAASDEHLPTDVTPVDGDWGLPLQAKLDIERGRRVRPDEVIEIVFRPGEYIFQTGLQIKESYINIIGDSAENTTIVHDPTRVERGQIEEFAPFLFQNGRGFDLLGREELYNVNISNLTVNFLRAGGHALGGVIFANCQNFRCEHVNIIGFERVYPEEERPLPVDTEEPIYDSHTNGIIVTGYSGYKINGRVSNCNVEGMSSGGIYLANAYNVDVRDCHVRGGVKVAAGFRVSSSKYIRLIGCEGSFNDGSGLQISHNWASLLGSDSTPGDIVGVDVDENNITFDVFNSVGFGLPSKLEAARLGVENLHTHRIEEIRVDNYDDDVEATDIDNGRHFVVHFSGSFPSDAASLRDIKLYINFVPNYDITFDGCTARLNGQQGIEIGSELHGAVGSDITLSGVTCDRNELCGIRATCAENVSIDRCVCTNNVVDGVYIYDVDLCEKYQIAETTDFPIFWNVTRNVRIDGCRIENNIYSGYHILGASNVTISRTTILTDVRTVDGHLEITSFHNNGFIYVEPLTFLTDSSTPHTKRIEDLMIREVNFTGTTANDGFINKLIGRRFYPFQEEDDHTDYSIFDAEGIRISTNENAVVSGRYNLSFTGDPNGNVNAPERSVFTDMSTGGGWWKSTEENSNDGWLELGFPYYDPDDRWWRHARPPESPPLSLTPLLPQPPQSWSLLPPATLPPQNWRLSKTIYQIDEIEKTEVVSLEELKATQPLKLEEKKRGLAKPLDTQNGVKIEILAPRTSSEILTLGEQRMPVFQQIDRKDRIKIEMLSPKIILEKR